MLNKNILMITILTISLLFISGCVAGNDNNSNETIIYKPTYEEKAIIGIDFAHWKAHEGGHYYKREYFTLSKEDDSGAVLNTLLITGNNSVHLLPQFISNDAPIEVIFYKFSEVSNNGTPVLYFNSNLNYNDTNGLKIFTNPTITNVGTYGGKNLVGSGNKIGGDIRGNSELILKPNEKYIFRITNKGSVSNIVNCNFDWYDED